MLICDRTEQGRVRLRQALDQIADAAWDARVELAEPEWASAEDALARMRVAYCRLEWTLAGRRALLPRMGVTHDTDTWLTNRG